MIAGVCERDLDLLFLEELSCNASFREFVFQHAGLDAGNSHVVRASRSVTESSGESDLEVTLRRADGLLARLLIENKLDAGFQPRQAERYRERAAAYVANGECSHVATLLVAPERYIATVETSAFDALLSYEAIRAHLVADLSIGTRRDYKAALLSSAIEKGLLGYQPEADAPVTSFWRAYWQLASLTSPELAMPEPVAKPAKAGFATFRPVALPKRVSICHKFHHGNVDLELAGWGDRLPDLVRHLGPYLLQGMELAQANKSAAVRIRVPRLHTASPFSSQHDGAVAGLAAARQLLDWFTREYPNFTFLVASA